jgi:hypothetical protein
VGTQVAPNATAFSQRGKHFMLEIIAAWEPCSKQALFTGSGRQISPPPWRRSRYPVATLTSLSRMPYSMAQEIALFGKKQQDAGCCHL